MSTSMPTSNSVICKFQISGQQFLDTAHVARYFKVSIVGLALLSVVSCCWNENSRPSNLTANPIARSAVNGTYAAHSASGEIYKLDLDFKNNLYKWQGIAADGRPSSGSIIENKSSGTFNLIANNQKNNTNQIRYMDNLLIGDFDFGSGSLPFVAIRTIESPPEYFEFSHTRDDANTLARRLAEFNTIGSD